MTPKLPKLAAPASRALARAGIQALDDLCRFTENEILALHGMGPRAVEMLREAMRENDLRFREETP